MRDGAGRRLDMGGRDAFIARRHLHALAVLVGGGVSRRVGRGVNDPDLLGEYQHEGKPAMGQETPRHRERDRVENETALQGKAV